MEESGAIPISRRQSDPLRAFCAELNGPLEEVSTSSILRHTWTQDRVRKFIWRTRLNEWPMCGASWCLTAKNHRSD